MELEAKLSLEELQDSDNVDELLSDEDSEAIGRHVFQTFEIDKQSRTPWERRMEDATELALQITKDKSYPWPNAANVKFPLLTIASLQFASRAYPALIKAPDLVKYRVQGKDPEGVKAARAQRISAHMSWQLLDEDESWEEDQDKAFLALPILGCVFKKSYYDPVKGHNCSKLVLPKDLYVHYYARSLEHCERKTEVFQLQNNEIRERELRKLFTEHDYGPAPMPEQKEEDKRQGITPPIGDEAAPRTFLEQHCLLDLDGDGYKEPYVVTVEKSTQKVARIVARFKEVTTEQSIQIEELQKRIRALAEGIQPIGMKLKAGQELNEQEQRQLSQVEQTIRGMDEKIRALMAEKPKVIKIEPLEYYTKYSFIPAPDGGFYDLGFGALLGPVNDSVNTLINQLLDSGTLNNGSVGFIGRGARIKGGKLRFSPFEWKRVDVSGATLRDSLVPLPANQPSAVLFNLLSLLISYAEKIGSVNDAMMGENPGQNTPAYNMSAMLEQGLQVFNGIFKRVYRSFRSELRKLYALNAVYLDPEEYFSYQDMDSQVLQTDYTSDPKDLIPAADPNAFSNKEKLMKAQAIAERAAMVPGYDPIKVEQRLLESLDIPDSAEVFPTTQDEQGRITYVFPPQPNPEFEIQRAEEQRRTLESQVRSSNDTMLTAAKVAESEARILLLMAQAEKEADIPELERLKLLAQDLGERRKALIEAAKIEQSKSEANSRVD